MPIRVVVSQISPPIRIVLILAVAVMGIYMFFLRPKPEEIPPVTPAGPSVSQPGQVRDAAEDAVDAANGQLQQQESVDGVDAGESAAGTASGTKKAQPGKAQAGAAATPAEDLKGLPKPLRKAIRADKILVVMFSNGKSYDDKAVEKELTKINRWDGRVYVHTAPLEKISKYGRIARGVNVEQSPTVVVADRSLKAETLVGYVDRGRIDQAVLDARRNTSGALRRLVPEGRRQGLLRALEPLGQRPVRTGPRSRRARWTGASPSSTPSCASFAADFKAIKAPKKWRGFHAATVADLDAIERGASTKSRSRSRPRPSGRSSSPRSTATHAAVRPAEKRVEQALRAAPNLPRCGTQF